MLVVSIVIGGWLLVCLYPEPLSKEHMKKMMKDLEGDTEPSRVCMTFSER